MRFFKNFLLTILSFSEVELTNPMIIGKESLDPRLSSKIEIS